ncbi:MAG: inositol monophosphatase family protein [Isosphaeraceae bacterium]
MVTRQEELNQAIAAVRQAAIFCHQIRLEKRIRSMTKSDGSPVTNADFGSQALIVQTLRKLFLTDPVMAEETASPDDFQDHNFTTELIRDLQNAGGSFATVAEIADSINRGLSESAEPHESWRDRYWVIDPIDGTKGYLKGGQYAIALGLIEKGQVNLAVLACPEFSLPGQNGTGLLLYAVKGEGAYAMPIFSDGEAKRLNVSDRSATGSMRMCESLNHSPTGTSAKVAAVLDIPDSQIDRMDSQAKYAAVASGAADIYLRLPTSSTYREAIWDHAAGVLIVEEAGGRVSDIYGQPLAWNDQRSWHDNHRFPQAHGIVVTNSRIHHDVIEAIRSVLQSAGETA